MPHVNPMDPIANTAPQRPETEEEEVEGHPLSASISLADQPSDDGVVPIKKIQSYEVPDEVSHDNFSPPDVHKQCCFVRFINFVIPRGGILSGMFNLASVTLGAGILSIPSAFKISGLVMGTIYLLAVTMLTVFSIQLLVMASDKSGYHSFEALARGLFGRGGDIFVGILMWVLCFGGAVGYVIAVGDVLKPIFDADGAPAFLRKRSGRQVITSCIWFCFMLPLVLPKQINSLRYVSAFGVTFIIFFVICVVVHSCQNSFHDGIRDDLVMVQTGNSGISGLAIFMFAYLCQVNAFKVYYEKKRPTPRKMTIEAGLSCTVCAVLYFLTGFFGYVEFGPTLSGTILTHYDPYAQPVFFVCFLGLIVKLCAAFSLNMLACRTALFQTCQWDVDTMPYWKHTIYSVSMAILALILGLFVSDINVVFGLVGAFCGGFIGFVFPALFIMYAGGWSRATVGWGYYLSTYFLLLAGVVAIVFGTGSSILSTVQQYS